MFTGNIEAWLVAVALGSVLAVGLGYLWKRGRP